MLSPTTWHRDLGIKMAAYAHAGVPHYWVVAPATRSVTVYRLGPDAAYLEEQHAEGDQEVALTTPVEATFSPADLLAAAQPPA